MTEFDFDELDKAVSDLMKDVDSPSAETPAEAANHQSAPAPAAPPSAPTPPSQSLAVKRRGKFMDMVRTPRPSRPLAGHSPIKIDQPDVEPQVEQSDLSGLSADEPSPVEIVSADNQDSQKDRPVIEPASFSEPVQSEDTLQPTPANDWPDPIDVMERVDNPVVEEPDAEPGEAEAQVSSEPDAKNPKPQPAYTDLANIKTVEDLSLVIEPELSPAAKERGYGDGSFNDAYDLSDDEAMESPFLPDTKVEKRPLGVFAPEASEPSQVVENQSVVEPATANPEIPRELSSELMNLDTHARVEPESEYAEPTEPQSSPAAEPASQAPAYSAQQAQMIPQYTEKPPTDTTPSGPIYDTGTYHQPLVAASEKKRSWVSYVVWVLVLLIIGACAGAAYFYFRSHI